MPRQSSIIMCIALLIGSFSLLGESLSPQDYPREFNPDPERFASSIEKFQDSDQSAMPPENAIVCTGSSSMKGWHNRIESDLEGLSLIPRGFGGSHFTDVIYFAEELIFKYKPRAVVVYEGDNDIADGKSPDRIRKDLAFLVRMCRENLPELRFYVLSIKPSIARWHLWDNAKEANRLMKAYCDETDGVTYIDIAEPMLGQNGKLPDNIFKKDMLHMSDRGYDLWKNAVRPVLIKHEGRFEPASE